VLRGGSTHVTSVAFSPNGAMLASGSLDHLVRVWDVESGALTMALARHSVRVASVAFAPNGKTVASGAEDTMVILWDVETEDLRRTLRGHSQPVTSLAFSPVGRVLATYGDSRRSTLRRAPRSPSTAPPRGSRPPWD
jgi:WD40 repeat protein